MAAKRPLWPLQHQLVEATQCWNSRLALAGLIQQARFKDLQHPKYQPRPWSRLQNKAADCWLPQATHPPNTQSPLFIHLLKPSGVGDSASVPQGGGKVTAMITQTKWNGGGDDKPGTWVTGYH